MNKRIFAIILIVLGGCNGSAPLLTCRDPCDNPKETRDMWCACRDWSDVGGTITPPPKPPGKPELYFNWEEALGCSLNRRVYIINYSDKPQIVTVSWKTPNSIDRKTKDYTVKANITQANYKNGVDLEYEEYSTAGTKCFDKDFMIAGYRAPQYATIEQSAIAQAAKSFPNLLLRRNFEIARLEVELNKIATVNHENDGDYLRVSEKKSANKVVPGPTATLLHDAKPKVESTKSVSIDCQKVCDSGDSIRCPIKGYPPDQDKLIALRDQLRTPPSTTDYSSANIYQIFGIEKQACSRSDIKFVSEKLYNNGQYCAFPMFLRELDTKPEIAIHFPENIRGARIAGDGAGGIAFNDGTSMPVLLFGDGSLNSNFGGAVTDALASDKGVYYQTTGTCIFIGIKQ